MKKIIKLIVKEKSLVRRLDNFISLQIADISRTRIKNLILDGFVKVNNKTNYNPSNKTISSYHNNLLIREGCCDERLLKEPDLLVWISSWMTLEPGDVVLTGAPSRVRDRVYFKDGDIFSCIIEGLGTLSNSFNKLE